MTDLDLDPETRAAMKYQSDLLMSVTSESEPALEKLIKDTFQTLFSRDKIFMVADLNIDQINYVFKLDIADKCFFKRYVGKNDKDHNLLSEVISDLLALSVSKGRKGREEGVSIASSIREKIKEDLMRKQLG